MLILIAVDQQWIDNCYQRLLPYQGMSCRTIQYLGKSGLQLPTRCDNRFWLVGNTRYKLGLGSSRCTEPKCSPSLHRWTEEPMSHYWRNSAVLHIEIRNVEDGRTFSYERHSHETFSIGAIVSGQSTYLNGDGSISFLCFRVRSLSHHYNPAAFFRISNATLGPTRLAMPRIFAARGRSSSRYGR